MQKGYLIARDIYDDKVTYKIVFITYYMGHGVVRGSDTAVFTEKQLKDVIRSGELDLENAVLTKNGRLRCKYHDMSKLLSSSSRHTERLALKVCKNGSVILADVAYGTSLVGLTTTRLTTIAKNRYSLALIKNKSEDGSLLCEYESDSMRRMNVLNRETAMKDPEVSARIKYLLDTVDKNEVTWSIDDFIMYMEYMGYSYLIGSNDSRFYGCDERCHVVHIPYGINTCEAIYEKVPVKCRKIIISSTVRAVYCFYKHNQYTTVDEIYFQKEAQGRLKSFNGSGLYRLEVNKSNMPNAQSVERMYIDCTVHLLKGNSEIKNIDSSFINCNVVAELSACLVDASFIQCRKSAIKLRVSGAIINSFKSCSGCMIKVGMTNENIEVDSNIRNIIEASFLSIERSKISVECAKGLTLEAIEGSFTSCDTLGGMVKVPSTIKLADSFLGCGIKRLLVDDKIRVFVSGNKKNNDKKAEQTILNIKGNSIYNTMIDTRARNLRFRSNDGDITNMVYKKAIGYSVRYEDITKLEDTKWPRTLETIKVNGDEKKQQFEEFLFIKYYDSAYFTNKKTLYEQELHGSLIVETVILDDNISDIQEKALSDTRRLKDIVFGKGIKELDGLVVRRLISGKRPRVYAVRGTKAYDILKALIQYGIIFIGVDSVAEAREIIQHIGSNKVNDKLKAVLGIDSVYRKYIGTSSEEHVELMYKFSRAVEIAKNAKTDTVIMDVFGKRYEPSINWMDCRAEVIQDIALKIKQIKNIFTINSLNMKSLIGFCAACKQVSSVDMSNMGGIGDWDVLTDNNYAVAYGRETAIIINNNKVCIVNTGVMFKDIIMAYENNVENMKENLQSYRKGEGKILYTRDDLGKDLNIDISNVLNIGDTVDLAAVENMNTNEHYDMAVINNVKLDTKDNMVYFPNVAFNSIFVISNIFWNMILCIDRMTMNFIEVNVGTKPGFNIVCKSLQIINKYTPYDVISGKVESIYSDYVKKRVLGY